jgi:mannose-6-phosphate isomerase-like protein (cupin superfamily)
MARTAKPSAERSRSSQPNSAQRSVVSRENAEHYRWGTDCDAWYMVNDEQLSVIEEVMPAGAAEIRHHHEKAQQFFYILSGEVLMEVEGQTTLVAAGTGIRIMPDSVTRFEIHRRARCGCWSFRIPGATGIASTNNSSDYNRLTVASVRLHLQIVTLHADVCRGSERIAYPEIRPSDGGSFRRSRTTRLFSFRACDRRRDISCGPFRRDRSVRACGRRHWL